MFKQITVGEVKRGERTYQLLCDPASPLGELHDVLLEMKSHCIERMEAIQKAEAPQQPQQVEQKEEHKSV